VARVHRRPELLDDIRATFGPRAEISFRLKPPLLTHFGLDRKVAIGRRIGRVLFAPLARMRRLRGRRLDPFGRSEERRIERGLIDEYRALAEEIAATLVADRYDEAVTLAGMADGVRGFGEVKLRRVASYRSALADALERWRDPTS
ncbi:MAG: DUF6537 domain-containing protein, partial [Acidimicrobiales bacterium]